MASQISGHHTAAATTTPPPQHHRDFLSHLETYLAKRDGVDKLLKITRYATKLLLASSLLPETLPLNRRLKSFESSVGVSRKAFRLGKFIQNVNALRRSVRSNDDCTCNFLAVLILSIIAHGGEGVYFFVEQFVWLVKVGVIDKKYGRRLGLVSAWAEFLGYFGSVGLKVIEIRRLNEERERLGEKEEEQEMAVRRKVLMKEVSVVQDLADGFMALADIRDGNGRVFSPVSLAGAGLLSALISTHKNWTSC